MVRLFAVSHGGGSSKDDKLYFLSGNQDNHKRLITSSNYLSFHQPNVTDCYYNTYIIEKLQRRACKLILGNDYTSLDTARKQLNILSFEETIFIHKAKVMYKIAHNIAPIYLTDLFQMRSNESNLNDSWLNIRSISNNQSRTNGPINAHMTIAQFMPR